MRSFAHLLRRCRFVGAKDVLEKLLDQIDVSKDHAAAAVAGKTEIVKGLTMSQIC